MRVLNDQPGSSWRNFQLINSLFEISSKVRQSRFSLFFLLFLFVLEIDGRLTQDSLENGSRDNTTPLSSERHVIPASNEPLAPHNVDTAESKKSLIRQNETIASSYPLFMLTELKEDKKLRNESGAVDNENGNEKSKITEKQRYCYLRSIFW